MKTPKKLRSRTGASSEPSAARRARYAIEPETAPHVREESTAVSAPGRPRVVSATEAARHFSDLINRVCYRGELYIVERGGKAMCTLSPVDARRCTGAELLSVLTTLPHPPEEFLAAVEDVTRRQSPVEPSAWEK